MSKNESNKPNKWVLETLNAQEQPRFKTNTEALVVLINEFEVLAKRMGYASSQELWEVAEHSCEFKEEYLEALHLQSQITFLKNHPLK